MSYASQALSKTEKYALETLAVVWELNHFHHLIYGHQVTVRTDHAAVKAVLGTPNPSAKHSRWWDKVYGCGARKVEIGKENGNADALSRMPHLPAPDEGICQDEVQVGVVRGDGTISELLSAGPASPTPTYSYFGQEQSKDVKLEPLISYLKSGVVPTDEQVARRVIAQAPQFTIVEGTLYLLDPKQKGRLRAVVPEHLKKDITSEHHAAVMAGHFSGPQLYRTLERRWWWRGMYKDSIQHAKNCPQCEVVGENIRLKKPPLQPIPVDRIFQIVGVDITELPRTTQGNHYVVVFQDFLSKFPLVFLTLLQIAKLLVQDHSLEFLRPCCQTAERICCRT